jgi:hypothetical protein
MKSTYAQGPSGIAGIGPASRSFYMSVLITGQCREGVWDLSTDSKVHSRAPPSELFRWLAGRAGSRFKGNEELWRPSRTYSDRHWKPRVSPGVDYVLDIDHDSLRGDIVESEFSVHGP